MVQETLQQSENDNNKNRRYGVVDERVKATYVRDSSATNKNAVSDAYVKFFRWATDRLGERDGIVCFVSNNGFLSGVAFDGFRKHLARDFTTIYHFDCKGNARTSGERRRQEGGNVFNDQIRTGVGMTLLIRRRQGQAESEGCKILCYRQADYARSPEKLAELVEKASVEDVPWQQLQPDVRGNWLTEGMQADYEDFLPLGTKDDKASKNTDVQAIFKNYGGGVKPNRDEWVYDWDRHRLEDKVQRFLGSYNGEVERWRKHGDKTTPIDAFVNYDDTRFKWSESLKATLKRGIVGDYDPQAARPALYRPFCKQWLYYDRLLNERVYQMPQFFPMGPGKHENLVINITAVGCTKDFHCLASDALPDLHLTGDSQCFPLYTYVLDGKVRRDNVTDWALGQFQDAYGPDVTKRDIFHYVYALLHHPTYRERYKENLKRELPRVPLVGGEDRPLAPNSGGTGEEPHPASPHPNKTQSRGGAGADESGAPPSDSPPPGSQCCRIGGGGDIGGRGATFRAFVDTGAQLAALHVGYEQAEEYPLTQVVNKDVPLSWRVTKMRLNADKTAVTVNESLALAGVPSETFGYRLGNRSALEWVLDQYQVTTDKRSGLVSDPNRADQPDYIARLIGRVVTVSVGTARLVSELPPLTPPGEESSERDG